MIRGVVFDADAAEQIARRLRSDGYFATVTRERFAGEDDDEDHPWVVSTDAPSAALDLLLDPYDGWLDDGADTPTAVTPLDLPDAPRRRHRE
ncbi:MAG TPA: hypothetical protein VFE07_06455 [Marmoricola sp.]|nr:hypothetical protein [Marmoricola sp.]